jgi:hypothetical protein
LRGGTQRVKLPLMFRHSVIKVAEWTGGVLAAIALLLGAGVWFLSRGPVSLDWLTPYVAATFSQSKAGIIAQVDHTFLSLGAGPKLEIIARGLHLKRNDGQAELALPQVSLSLSAHAALLGKVAPTDIVLHGAHLNLLRSEDGSFHLGLSGEKIGNNDWAESLLQLLMAPPDQTGALSHLREISISNASLTVDDKQLGVTWEAQRLDAQLRRDGDGFSGQLAMAIQHEGSAADLHGNFDFAVARHQMRTKLTFANFRPSVYAAAAPALAAFAAFDLPLAGTIEMSLDTDTRKITAFAGNMSMGQGRIVNDRLAGGELKIVKGTLQADYDPKTQRLVLQRFHAALNEANGPTLDFTGAIEHFDPFATGRLPFSGNGQIRDVTLADLKLLWPEQAAIHARNWIMEHLLKGTLTHAEVALGGTIALGSAAGLVADVTKVDGNMAYRDLSIQYFPPLSPVHDIDGTAHFNRAEFILYPKGGIDRDVRATGGTVLLTKLDTDNEEATVNVSLAGPLATVIDELNLKPLRFAHAVGIEPANVKGNVAGEVHFHLPMKKGVNLSMVDFSARGKLSDVAINKVLFDRDLSAGALNLAVDRKGLDIDGTARLNGVPVALDWKENFGNSLVRTQYRLHGEFDDAARHALGVDWLSKTVTGTVGVDLNFTRRHTDFAETNATLDLTKASLGVDQLGWSKKAGVPATAHFIIDSSGDQPTRITDLSFKGGGLDGRFDATLTGSGTNATIASANIYRLTVGQTDIAGVVSRRPQGGWSLQVHGRSFDASKLLDDMQKSAPGAERAPPLEIEAHLGKVLFAPTRSLTEVKAKLFSDGLHWQSAQLDAVPAPGKKLTLRFGGAAGERNFQLTSDDLGGLLQLLDISSEVRGGTVTVTARAEDGQDGRRVLKGKIDGRNYSVVNAPALAQLLSLASFTGAASLANGQGILFSRMEADFVLDNGTAELNNARAYGEAIGINASGEVDYRDNTLNMSGTIVPAYLLNSLLSNIPLVGALLGGKGQGIFAANFRITGSATNPGISVNPLSALAPGFLRGLFLFDAGTPSQDDARATATPPHGG